MNISKFGVNEEAEVKGIWMPIGEGARVLVARDGNTVYTNLLRERMSHHKSAVGLTDLTDEESAELMIGVEAETILLDWEGLEDETGLVDYSIENAVIWLTKYKEFRKLIFVISRNIDNYREKSIAEAKDNLKK